MIAADLPLSFQSEKDFEKLFRGLFKPLVAYAFTMVKDEQTAEEIVQNVFARLWTKRENIQIELSPKAYLYKAVYFETVNVLKHEKVKNDYKNNMKPLLQEAENQEDKMATKQLEQRIRKALDQLPEPCKNIFMLSRFGSLKYREIAQHLSIPEKTVENQMGKALKLLRTQLADYLVTGMAIVLFLLNSY